MARKKKNNVTGWMNYINNHKTKVIRIYHKNDTKRKTPYIFDYWIRDYETNEKLIKFHTKKEWDDELDQYKSYVITEEKFKNEFIEVEEEI